MDSRYQKKSKKYFNHVNMHQNNALSSQKDSSINSIDQLSRTYVSKKQKQQYLEEFNFQFDCKIVLHLWLAEILPGPRYKEIKYDFQHKKIKGDRRECKKKIQQCQKFSNQYKLKLYQQSQLEHNEGLLLQRSIQIKIFTKKQIQKAAQDLIQNYSLRELKDKIKPVLSKKYVYMMSILKKDEQIFSKIIQKIQNSDRINRSDIKTAQQERQKRQIPKQKQKIRQIKQKGKEILSQIQDFSINFDNNQQDIGQQSKIQNESQKSQDQQMNQILRLAKKQSNLNSMKKQPRQIEKKSLIYTEEINKSIFNIVLFKNWLLKNNKLKENEVEINQQNDKIKIQVFSTENNKIKREQLNFYFNFYKFIIFENKMEIYEKLKDFVQKNNKNQVNYQFFQGFVTPKTKQNEIKKLYRQNKLSSKKTNKNNHKISLIYLKGIKPNVQNIFNQIISRQKQILRQKEIINWNFTLNLNNIEFYIAQKRVQKLVLQTITQIFSKYTEFKLIDICCPVTKVTVRLEIKQQLKNQFINKWQPQIQKIVCKKIRIQDIMNVQDLDTQLYQKYLLFQSKNDSSKVILIEQQQKLMQSTKAILKAAKQDLKKLEITIKKNRLPILKQFIEKLKSKQTNMMKNVQISYINDANITKIQIYATKYCQKINDLIRQQLARLDNQILQKMIIVSDMQAFIIEKNMCRFQKQIQNNNRLSFVLSKDIKIEALITLGPTHEAKTDDPTVIYIYKQKCLTFLPKNTTFIFLSLYDLSYIHESSLEDIKQFFQSKKYYNNNTVHYMQDNRNKYTFIYYPVSDNLNMGIKKSILQSKQKNKQPISSNKYQNFVFFMPKNKKIQFLKQIVNFFYQNYGNQKNRIFIFEHALQNLTQLFDSMREMDKASRKKTKIQYFVRQGIQQFNYSASGERKIQQALGQGLKKIALTNPDLNLKDVTHLCSFKEQKLIHIQSRKQTKLYLYPDKVTFILNGIQFQMPIEQVKKVQKNNKNQPWVQVSLGVYQLDFDKNIQTNLFTGFTRVIEKKQIKIVNPNGKFFLNIDFDHTINEVQVCYKPDQEQDAHSVCEMLKDLIQKQKITLDYQINRNFTEQKFQQLKQNCKSFNIQIQWKEQKIIQIQGSDKNVIDLVTKQIQIMSFQYKNKIVYPQYWCPQTQQIQTFIVPPESIQYKQVQAQFKIFPIKQLLRIQNKIVYENYLKQKELLIKLNEGKPVKQMMLYHGTKMTDPKIIYQDKEQCFNVNFTGQSNYLGKGTYFAEKAVYSKSYQHTCIENGEVIHCMFYCIVMVGDSQHFNKQTEKTKQMKNTNFKDQIKKIRYQSTSLNTHRSKIYAVYKNRRAYPHYLIKY